MADEEQTPGSMGSIADDEAAFKRGRGRMVAAYSVVAIALLAGGFALMSSGDDARVYGDLGRKINGVSQAHFDQFWGCALQGANLKDIKTNTQLQTQLSGRAAARGAAYGVYLRDKCLPKLDDIEPQLDTLIVPPDMKNDVDGMKAAASKLRGALSALCSYLDDPELKYDSDSAGVYYASIARGWFDFKQAHGSANKTLKAKLGVP